MTATIQPAAGLGSRRSLIIALVAVLAIAIGAAAGAFLLTGRAAAAGVAATYVPATAPFYVEVRLEPSEAQDAELRELLGRFPLIEGVDLERPLYDQLGEVIDEALAEEEEVELSWSEDVVPWFDGRIGFAVTELDMEELSEPMDPMDPTAAPEVPGMIVVLGVTDAAAARETLDRLASDFGMEATESEHRGVRIVEAADEGAYAVTDDAVLVGPDADAIVAALDVHADTSGTLASTEHLAALVEQLPSDWLVFAAYDYTDVMAATMAQGQDEATAAALEAILEHQSMRGAMALTAEGDRVLMEAVTDAPTGPFAVENADRALAAEVPADTIYYSEAANIGSAFAAVIDAFKEAAATDPAVEEQIGMAEAALGAELGELVSWIDDGALAAGWTDEQPWLGFVLVPSDVDAAERRLDQLTTFANLATMDPSIGIEVGTDEIAGAEVTTIRWEDPAGMVDPMMPAPAGIVVQFTVTDDRAVIGFGDGFVARVLELDEADSLASVERYTTAIAELGGATNAAETWLDLTALREAVMTAVEPMMAFLDPSGGFADEIEPWLVPLDRIAGVTVLEDDLLVQRGALFVE